jgi:hypothetical protein
MVASKSTKSSKWFARIDGEVEYLRPKMLAFASQIDVQSILSTHHTGKKKENPHCHCVIEMATEVQKQSFALRLKRHFEVVDRGYALDTWDGRKAEYGAVSYLYHEDDAPTLVSKNWSPEDLAEARRIAKDANAVIEKAKDKASIKWVDKALDHFSNWETEPTQYQVFSYLLEEVHARRTYWPGGFKAKQLVEEVGIKLTPNLSAMTNQLYNTIWR